MIDLYTWGTPNGHKVHLMLEECGLDYRVHAVNIGAGEQFDPAFLAISPNNKIPALIDSDGPDGQPISLFESGAILLYLASKTGKLLPADVRGRYEVLQWLMWQMGGFGPMLGQNHHFALYAPEKIPYAIDRYRNETHRLYRVLNDRLADRDYVAGDYSIADMAIVGWAKLWERQGIVEGEFPAFAAWLDRVMARPAVQRGLALAGELRNDLAKDTAAQKVLFGQR